MSRGLGDVYKRQVINILRSKKEEIILKMNLVSKDEIDILNKRIENLEKKIAEKKIKKKTKRAKR